MRPIDSGPCGVVSDGIVEYESLRMYAPVSTKDVRIGLICPKSMSNSMPEDSLTLSFRGLL